MSVHDITRQYYSQSSEKDTFKDSKVDSDVRSALFSRCMSSIPCFMSVGHASHSTELSCCEGRIGNHDDHDRPVFLWLACST